MTLRIHRMRYATHIAVVEIDPETGHIEIPRYAVAHDCGKVANPLLVEGQIVGGVVQGIGQVLREKVVYDANGFCFKRER